MMAALTKRKRVPLTKRPGPTTEEEILGKGLTKQDRWLLHYLNEGADTFMDKAKSIDAAGFNFNSSHAKSQHGRNLYEHHKEAITKWLDDVGLSEAAIKQKLARIADQAFKKTYASHQGRILDERTDPDFTAQLAALEKVIKLGGFYAPEKLEHSGATQIEIVHVKAEGGAE